MHNNEYETVYISSSELSEEQYTILNQKVLDLIAKHGGQVLVDEKWGRRKLAYPIRKQHYANYTLIDFVGPANLPSELARLARLDDKFMRLLTVRVDERVDAEVAEEAAKKRSVQRLERLQS